MSLKSYNKHIGLSKGRLHEVEQDDDGDDLAEEIGQPERWVAPTNVLIEVPEIPPQDKLIELPEKEVGEEKAVADREELMEAQVSTEKKRIRSEPESDTEKQTSLRGKKLKMLGMKKYRESEDEGSHQY